MATEKIECQGVVLNALPYGESDRIIRIYTERMGKISVLVKGAKSRRSRYLALSEVFTFGVFRISRGKSFYYLNGGKILQPNLALRERYDRLIFASAIVEVVDKSSFEGEGTAKIFSLIRKALDQMAKSERPMSIFMAFAVKYMAFMGYRPLLPETGEGDYIFSFERGIVEREREDEGFNPVDPADIYTFRHLLYTSLDKINLDEIDGQTIEKVYGLLTHYMKVNLDLYSIQSLQLRL